LVLSAEGTPAGVILSSLNKIGWSVPTIGDIIASTSNLSVYVTPSLLSTLDTRNDLQITVYSAGAIPAAQRSAQLNSFVAAIKAKGPITQSITDYMYGWDYIWVSALAANQAKTLNGPAMAQALENFQPPATPPYLWYKMLPFTSTNHSIPADPSTFTVIPFSNIDSNGFYP
jgi:branched-chain amino acid transport system substrate-binding protein